MYLLDAPVVLELRKARASDPGLAQWAANIPRQNLFLSALSLLELENAARTLKMRDKSHGEALSTWITDQVVPAFGERILPIDATIVRRRAQLPYTDNRDGLLAATALEHSMVLATNSPQKFKPGRVKTVNPWGYTPDQAEDDLDWGQASRAGPLWLRNLFIRS